MPWHLGGPPWLTYLELEAYIRHYNSKRKSEKEAARKGQPRSR